MMSPRYTRWSTRLRRCAAVAGAALIVTGCATVPPAGVSLELHAPTDLLVSDPGSCQTGWAPNGPNAASALDAQRITLVNWNLQKGSRTEWHEQLGALLPGADVLTLQEAPVVHQDWQDHASDLFHSFAPGWSSRRTPTGVVTMSDAAPLVQCNLQAVEPWLGTPKAMLATEYALVDRDDTLLVVNVHAVNFALGLAAFDGQLAQVDAVVAQHQGPVILSGDFNTWRQARANRLGALVEAQGLVAVPFENDARKRFLGQALDHVYVRGLSVIDSATYETDTSDHNPMRVWLTAI